MLAQDEKSIIALCTPQGAGALALVRLVGKDVFERAASFTFLSSKQSITQVPSHTVHHGFVRHPLTHQLIDEVMFIALRGPRTFTGQDTIEITLHNNPFLIAALFDAALEVGIVRAEAGDFSKRAFLNGKIDLLQAEAIHEVITAANESQVHAALLQLQGSFSSVVHEIENELLSLLVHVEASFEFLDEEQRDLDFQGKITLMLTSLIDNIDRILEKNQGQQRIKDGVRIALIGSVNAGKSTLFNGLVGKKRAIVSPHAGTTRDTIEASLYSAGFFRTYVDTAGIRKTDDVIEREGIERAEAEGQSADLLLLVVDGSMHLSSEQIEIYNRLLKKHAEKILIVCTKSDIKDFMIPEWLSDKKDVIFSVSTENHAAMQQLTKAVDAKIVAIVGDCKAAYLLNNRQAGHLQVVQTQCREALQAVQAGFQVEIIALHLHQALEQLVQLTGKNVTERCHDEIFRNFCVGK
jgi:tRNA modification GTPase